MRYFLSFLYMTAFFCISNCAGWNYTHTDSWKNEYPTCGSSKQSPVALIEKDMNEDTQLTPFQFIKESPTLRGMLRNDGYTAAFLIDHRYVLTVRGGNLGEDFIVFQFNFHWGEDSTTGSEHTLNGKTYPMEFQILAYNKSYGHFDNAFDRSDGLAALGFFIEEGGSDNTNFNPITNALVNIRNKGNIHDVTGISLTNIIGSKLTTYFRYKGSLTTPRCYESIVWTIFREPLSMSSTQLERFRNLTDSSSNPLVNNYRPVQPLNSRKVFTQRIQTTKSPQTTQPTEPPQTTQPTEPPQTTQFTEPKTKKTTYSTQSPQPKCPQLNRSERVISSFLAFFSIGVVLIPYLIF